MIHSLTNPAVLLNLACLYAIFSRWLFVPEDRKRTEYLLGAFIFVMLGVQGALPFMDHVTLLRPFKYDLYVLRFDDILSDPGFLIAQMVGRSPILYWVARLTYGVLHLAMMVAFTATLYLRPQDLRLLVKSFVLNLLLAVPIYLLVPVCGPAYAFPDFPRIHGMIAAHPIALSAPCNGIPSVHMSTALLVFWFTRHWRLGRIFGAAFTALTVFATLGTGEHYVFDLCCAVPYAIAIYCVAEVPWRLSGRRRMEPLAST